MYEETPEEIIITCYCCGDYLPNAIDTFEFCDPCTDRSDPHCHCYLPPEKRDITQPNTFHDSTYVSTPLQRMDKFPFPSPEDVAIVFSHKEKTERNDCE